MASKRHLCAGRFRGRRTLFISDATQRRRFRLALDRLSTGGRQPLGLARTLALSPDCLLLDEPTSGLDETNRTQVEVLIFNHLTKGGAALMVTHDLAQARRLTTFSLRFENARNERVSQADRRQPGRRRPRHCGQSTHHRCGYLNMIGLKT